jgi:hypothetical protein
MINKNKYILALLIISFNCLLVAQELVYVKNKSDNANSQAKAERIALGISAKINDKSRNKIYTFIPNAYIGDKPKPNANIAQNGQNIQNTNIQNTDKVVANIGSLNIYLTQNIASSNVANAINSLGGTQGINSYCGFCKVVVDEDGIIYVFYKQFTIRGISNADAKELENQIDDIFLNDYSFNMNMAFFKITNMDSFSNIISVLDNKKLNYALEITNNFPVAY